jgi:hypothetical protein
MDIDQHCLNIIQFPRIRNKIVVLCEGEQFHEKGRLSPQLYGRSEELPDCNFYQACLPAYWRDRRPMFFNSGSRGQVIKTFHRLQEICNEQSNRSYLAPDKLFAIIDRDIQSEDLTEAYPFADTGAAAHHLYDNLSINTENTEQHRIWLTGLIHKEAYFLVPELQDFFDEVCEFSCHQRCHYKENLLDLNVLYQEMSQHVSEDRDLGDRWPESSARVKHCSGLQLETIESFRDSWQNQWRIHTSDKVKLNQLAYALLAIRKAKPYWEQVHPGDQTMPDDCTEEFRKFREDISLQIGRQFYSKQEGHPHQHLAYFFKHLYEFEHSFFSR